MNFCHLPENLWVLVFPPASSCRAWRCTFEFEISSPVPFSADQRTPPFSSSLAWVCLGSCEPREMSLAGERHWLFPGLEDSNDCCSTKLKRRHIYYNHMSYLLSILYTYWDLRSQFYLTWLNRYSKNIRKNYIVKLQDIFFTLGTYSIDLIC